MKKNIKKHTVGFDEKKSKVKHTDDILRLNQKLKEKMNELHIVILSKIRKTKNIRKLIHLLEGTIQTLRLKTRIK